GEGAVAVIVIKEIILVGVRYEQIEKTVVVIIGPATIVGVALAINDGTRGDLGETTLAIVVIKPVVAGVVYPHKQIQKTVVVVIPPGRAKTESAVGRNGRGKNSRKGAVAVVRVKQAWPGARRDEQILKPIIVEIAPREDRRVDPGHDWRVGNSREGI